MVLSQDLLSVGELGVKRLLERVLAMQEKFKAHGGNK